MENVNIEKVIKSEINKSLVETVMPQIRDLFKSLKEDKSSEKNINDTTQHKAVTKSKDISKVSRRTRKLKQGQKTANDNENDNLEINRKKKLLKRSPKDKKGKIKNTHISYEYDNITSDERDDDYMGPICDDNDDDDNLEFDGLSKRIKRIRQENIEPVFFEPENIPQYITKYVDNIHTPTSYNFSTSHNVPLIIQRMAKGNSEMHQANNGNIFSPMIKLEKCMQNQFDDKIFELLEDHLQNEYKITKVPYAAFIPYTKQAIPAIINLSKTRAVINLFWNFTAILPQFMTQIGDSDFNKLIDKFFIKPLLLLFSVYESQVYLLRFLTWPKELREFRNHYIKLPLIAGSLWNIKEQDALKLSEQLRIKRKTFFRGNSKRYRGRSGRGRHRSNFRNVHRRPARSTSDK